MNIDISRLRADMNTLERRIRGLKARLRRPWTEPMARVQAELLELAAEATELYTLRAWVRGRLHRSQPPRALRDTSRSTETPLQWDPREYHQKIAQRVAQRYPPRPPHALAAHPPRSVSPRPAPGR